ncbi:MAG: prolyl oligopeptidase family serine peptidase, partial [Candidatus Eisenbacteria bacterium]
GGEGVDDMGGADVDDVRHALTVAAGRPGADPAHLHLYGESRGGMMALQAMRDGARVRSAAVMGAFTDLDSLLAGDERARGAAAHIWPDFPARRAELALRRSAVRWADSLRVPLLLLHGGADRSVSPRQSLALATRLDALGREYELHVLVGGSHTLAERGAQRDSMVIGWFRAHP